MFKLRPHHLIDIIRNIGQHRPVKPHDYGHAQHIITSQILDNPGHEVLFVVGADDLCAPCMHLSGDGNCRDVLPQFTHKVLKQQYNDELDGILLKFLDISTQTIMTVTEFICIVEENLEGLVPLCTHPGESFELKREGLMNGILLLRAKA